MYESFTIGQFPFRTMTLTGQGKVTASPDTAVIRLGVETIGTDLAAIQSQNALASQAVLDALHRMGLADVKTVQYTVEKYYEYENGTPVHRGYVVRNILEIRTKDISQLGAIIDGAVNAGSNVVDLITIEVSNPDYYYRQALNMAIADAIGKAESISANLGIQVESIPVSIREAGSVTGPPPSFQRELAMTPIIPGNVTIDASVTAEFLY